MVLQRRMLNRACLLDKAISDKMTIHVAMKDVGDAVHHFDFRGVPAEVQTCYC